MNATAQLILTRQFYMRCIVALGITWGTVPLITLPFLVMGAMDVSFDVWAVILNGLTVMPASVLAIWHRRSAAAWMGINGSLVAVSSFFWILRNHTYPSGAAFGAGISLLITGLLIYTEIQKWPGAISTES